MRLLLQRVKQAEVFVDKSSIGAIGQGLLVFVGIHKEDTEDVIDPLISKVLHLRIFPDESEKMSCSVLDIGGSILVVSQFTLYGNCEKGRRPDFISSAEPTKARALYEKFIIGLKKHPIRIATGQFGAHMEVSLVNDGPVTLLIEKESSLKESFL